jgi:hypothetical protein
VIIYSTEQNNDKHYNSGFRNLGTNATLTENYIEVYNNCCDWNNENTQSENAAIIGNDIRVKRYHYYYDKLMVLTVRLSAPLVQLSRLQMAPIMIGNLFMQRKH